MKQPLLAFLLLLAAFTCFSGQAQTTCAPTAGLVAYYPFEETQGITAQDASGHLGPGQLSGGTWQPKAGRDGRGALVLTGSDHFDIPLNWQPTTFSVSFWIEPTQRFNWSQRMGAVADWGAFTFHSTYTGQIYVGTDVNSRIHYTASNTVEWGVWQHFVFTIDNGVGALYKNGQLLDRHTNMALPLPWQGMRLGSTGDELYDEVRVYDRALSAQEATGLYQCLQPAGTYECRAPTIDASPNTSIAAGQTTTLQAKTRPAALQFDGVADHVTVTIPGTTTPVPLSDVVNNFTVEAWVNPTAN